MATSEAVIALGPSIARLVSDDFWDQDITDESPNSQVTTFVARFLTEDLEDDEYDQALLGTFQEIFTGWTATLFDRVEKRARKFLKNGLRTKGIFLPYRAPSRNPIATQLADLVDMENYPEWPDDEVVQGEIHPTSAVFRRRQQLLAHSTSQIPLELNQTANDIRSDSQRREDQPSQTIERDQEPLNDNADTPLETHPAPDNRQPAADENGVQIPYLPLRQDVPQEWATVMRHIDGNQQQNTTNLNVDVITDELIQRHKRFPLTPKWGHLWFHLQGPEAVAVNLTETD